MNKHILVANSDRVLLEVMSANLEMAGYLPLRVTTAATALEYFRLHGAALVISEVEFPDAEAWEVIERLRLLGNVPLIILSSRGDEIDKLHGFRLGADDYITRPFSFAELLARVGAVLARCSADESQQRIETANLLIDLGQRCVLVNGRSVSLSPTEFRVLEVLVRRAPRAVSSEELVNEVWGPNYLREFDHVKHFIWRLRRKLADDSQEARHIITVRGFGYRFAHSVPNQP